MKNTTVDEILDAIKFENWTKEELIIEIKARCRMRISELLASETYKAIKKEAEDCCKEEIKR